MQLASNTNNSKNYEPYENFSFRFYILTTQNIEKRKKERHLIRMVGW